jgi:hypothetical protein
MKSLSNWRSVRLWEGSVARDLRQRHRLWLHGWCIGFLVLGLMWGTAHIQLLMGSQSLALRYLVTLGVGYLGYLLTLQEALLTVAVELAFGWVSARTAIRVVREGWLSAAVRLTWKPLLGAVFCAVLLGATIDYFIPAARSLPHALTLTKASRH